MCTDLAERQMLFNSVLSLRLDSSSSSNSIRVGVLGSRGRGRTCLITKHSPTSAAQSLPSHRDSDKSQCMSLVNPPHTPALCPSALMSLSPVWQSWRQWSSLSSTVTRWAGEWGRSNCVPCGIETTVQRHRIRERARVKGGGNGPNAFCRPNTCTSTFPMEYQHLRIRGRPINRNGRLIRADSKFS